MSSQSRLSFPLTFLVLAALLGFAFSGCSSDSGGNTDANFCESADDCDGSDICVDEVCVADDTDQTDAGDETDADDETDAGDETDANDETDTDDFECPAGESLCAEETCADLDNDPLHCGECGNPCPYGTCESGDCVVDCDPDASPFGGGDGTEEAPFSLCSVEHLQNIHGSLDAHFLQFTGIDLSDASFVPIGTETSPFNGHFYGGDYSINGLTLDRIDEDDVGLFRHIGPEGRVERITLKYSSITGNHQTGSIAGVNHGTIDICSVDATVTGGRSVGGVVGINAEGGVINGCDVSVDQVVAQEIAGGIAGTNNGTISHSSAAGELGGTEDHTARTVGGIVGQTTGSLVNAQSTITIFHTRNDVGGVAGICSGDCTISASSWTGEHLIGSNRIGGLVGSSSGTIDASHATGNVEGNSDVGGLVGSSSGTIDASHATGNVEGDSDVGGLVGSSSGTIDASHATGNVEGDSDVGGLVGSSSGTIDASHATGNVEGDSDVGGLVGSSSGSAEITDSYASGAVAGSNENIGGFVGSSSASATIERCYASGAVNTTAFNVGGFVGSLGGATIEDAYAIGNVHGESEVGGFAGKISDDSTISNVYSRLGAVSAANDAYLGGLIGSNDHTEYGNVTNSYWTEVDSGVSKSAGGDILATPHFEDPDRFDGWDFVDVWTISDIRPVFQWE